MFTIDIHKEDVLELITAIDTKILTINWFCEIDDKNQGRIDNLQRIKDGLQEMLEFGGR